MSEMTKEILAELGLFGQTLPRYLHIPMITNPPATDILNIQFTVMDMLVDDPEIASVVSNHWNLAFEIRAFNVQNQVWDLLELDADVELPARASVQILIKNNEPDDQLSVEPEPVFSSKRDPRRKHTTPVPETKIVSKRDPRRKNREPEPTLETPRDVDIQEPSKPFVPSRRDPRKRSQAVVAELEAAKVVAKPIVLKEPNIKNLSKNDPRRKRLLEKSKSQISTPFSSPFSSPAKSTQPVEKTAKHESLKQLDNDSDSDEGNLQIDESFDEKGLGSTSLKSSKSHILNTVKPSTNPVMINESQLEDSSDKKLENRSSGLDDVGLWDEIYGVTNDTKDGSLNIFDPKPTPVRKPTVKQLVKSIGLETFKKNIRPQIPSSPDSRIVNISDDGEMRISVTPEKRRKSPVVISPDDLTIDLTKEVEISDRSKSSKSKKRKSEEQLEKEKLLLLNLVKERDRMNEIVASVPLPDEIIIDREIEEGELSESTNNSDTEQTPSREHPREDFFSPESPKGLQIDMDTEESEIDIIPLEREEVLLKHKKYASRKNSRKKTTIKDPDSDIEEIPLPPPVKGISKTKEKITNMEDIENPDKYKKYWEEFPEEFQDKSKYNTEKDLKSGLKKLSDMKSKDKSHKNSNPNWALKNVVKTLSENKSEETVPSQSFWKGTSGLSSYSEKIRQKVQERLSSGKEKEEQVVENLFLNQADSADISISSDPPAQKKSKVLSSKTSTGPGIYIPPPLRKALLDTPVFPPPVKGVLPPSVSKPNFPTPPPPQKMIFNSSIPPPVPPISNFPPLKSTFQKPPSDISVPPPIVIPGFPPPSPSFPPTVSPFSSPPPILDTKQSNGTWKTSAQKVPSLLDMHIPRPNSLEPESKPRGSAWLDPLLPQGRPGGVAEGSGGRQEPGKLNKDRSSRDKETSRKRSRSRDRVERNRDWRASRKDRSVDRDRRSSDRDRRRRRSRSRSRSGQRRRHRDERRGSQDSSSSQDSVLRRESGREFQDTKAKRKASEDERTKDPDKNNTTLDEKKDNTEDKPVRKKESQEDHDNLMLCFYEGEDCMDDPGDPDLNYDQSSLANINTINSREATKTSAAKEDLSGSNASASFSLVSCLASLVEDRESKQLFPEPVPAISASASKSQPGSSSNSLSVLSGKPDMISEEPFTPVLNTPAPPAPPSISGNAPPPLLDPPNRGEVYRATLGLSNKHPVSAVYEYSNRMKYPNPWFVERWGPGGGWAYDVTLGPSTYSSPWFKTKKRDAKMEACRYALQQLGIFTKAM